MLRIPFRETARGEIDEIKRTTSGSLETMLVYLTFSPLSLGMMIGGLTPGLYLRHAWLWKALQTSSALFNLCRYIPGTFAEARLWNVQTAEKLFLMKNPNVPIAD